MYADATHMQEAERRGLIYSLVMHVILLVIFILGLPNFISPPLVDEPTAITVDILPISAMSNIKPSNSKPVKKKDKPKEQPKDIIEKTLEDLKAEKAKPSPIVKTKDTAPTPPKTEEKEDAPPEEKPEEKPVEEQKKEEDPLDAILKGVKDTAAKEKKSASEAKEKTESSDSGNRSNRFDPNSPEAVSIRDAIQSQIYRCWNVPAGARNAEDLIVPLEIDYDKQGNPMKVNLAKSATARYRKDPFFRAAADSAMRAVRRCAPLQNMPADSFKIWQYIDMNFNPREMLF